MRATALTRSLLTIGLVASAGAGCGQFDTLLDAIQRHNGGTTSSPTGWAGTSGSTTGAAGSSGGVSASCVAEMGPTGVCKRCYDPSGVLVHEDCPPPPATVDPACVEITEGGPGTCADYATYKIRSADVCAQKNLFISNLKPGPMCGSGGVESMTFVCCPPPAPTPITMCVKIADGGPTSCKDAATWKQYGADACKQQNLPLTDVIGGTKCSAGYQDVTYVCCVMVPSGSTGTGGAGGSTGTPPPPKCGQTTDASGQLCKTCWDSVTGQVISNECGPGTTGSGGSGGGGQSCDVKTNADGSQCKTCTFADGTTASSCLAP